MGAAFTDSSIEDILRDRTRTMLVGQDGSATFIDNKQGKDKKEGEERSKREDGKIATGDDDTVTMNGTTSGNSSSSSTNNSNKLKKMVFTADETSKDVDINDPLFWEKIMPNAKNARR